MKKDALAQTIADSDRPAARPPIIVGAPRWADSVRGLKATERSLLLALAAVADPYGCSWYRQKELARRASISDRTVRNALKVLEEKGILRRIGRMGPCGARTTDVVVLRAWPDRLEIPKAGHPKLGSIIVEDKYDRLFKARKASILRTQIPGGAESLADKNINTEETLPTYPKAEKVVGLCLKALGPWATSENEERLTADMGGLEEWLSDGIEQHTILAALAKKSADKRNIPLLWSWRYFDAFIRKFAKDQPPSVEPPRPKSNDVAGRAVRRSEADDVSADRPSELRSGDNEDMQAEIRRFTSSLGHAKRSVPKGDI